MSGVNTHISLIQVYFSRHYLFLIGCMSRVKTLLASVGLGQVCSPYSAQLSCHSMIWFGTCINTIKLIVERHKAFYSVGSSNNWCSISTNIDIFRVLIHKFLNRSKSYYEIKCRTCSLMANITLFMWFVATHALNTR